MTVFFHRNDMGHYAEYDDETDVLTALIEEKGPVAETWEFLPESANEPGLEVGRIRVPNAYDDTWLGYRTELCPDCDEELEFSGETATCPSCKKDVAVSPRYRQVALRLHGAKRRGEFSLERVLWLSSCFVDITLLNVLRHGQLALAGQHWRPFQPLNSDKPAV